jgi:DNA-binding LacI/PurR family transcriptional regulator
LRDQGIGIPAEVAVIGFDDIPAASLANPPLTTIAQDTRRAGEALVDTLLKLIGDEPATGTVFPARLAIRQSCGAVI